MTCQHQGQPDTEDGGCILCWKERCERVEACCAEMRAVINDCTCDCPSCDSKGQVKSALSSSCGQDFVPRSELDKYKAACAEWKRFADTLPSPHCCEDCPCGYWADELKHLTESSSCGQGYLPPDKVRVLVEALETAKEIIVRIGTTACGCEDTEWYGKATAWLNKYPALARLKEAQ